MTTNAKTSAVRQLARILPELQRNLVDEEGASYVGLVDHPTDTMLKWLMGRRFLFMLEPLHFSRGGVLATIWGWNTERDTEQYRAEGPDHTEAIAGAILKIPEVQDEA